MKKISVVIPYYNDSKYISNCLESVLSQSLKPMEVIIVDDCSEDSSVLDSIISNVSTTEINIRVIRNKTNMNGAYSRNLGMKMASGEYIALLDGDDYWSSDHLDCTCGFLVKKDCDFVYSNVNEIFFEEIRKRKVSDINLFTDNPVDILLYSPPQTNSFFFKRDMIDEVKFDESLKRHQDYQFFIDACLNSKTSVLYLDNFSTYYRVRTSDKPIIDYMSIFKFWQRYLNLVNVKMLRSKLWNIIAGGMRDRRVPANEVITSDELTRIMGNKGFIRFIKYVKNDYLLRVLVVIYFYVYIDKLNVLFNVKRLREWIRK